MYKVPLTKIVDIFPHPGADRLDIAVIYGFHVVIAKNRYSIGDKVIFVPPDSVFTNQHVEDHIFPKDSKIKLNSHRVKHIRIRGFQSYGMIIHPNTLKEIGIYIDRYSEEDCLSELLGIIKYEPPEPEYAVPRAKTGRKKVVYENFHEYNGVEALKWFPDLFKEGEEVIIQEKQHGSNWRGSMMPTQANTLWKKILKFFNRLPEYEFVYGSNRVQITGASDYKGYYGSDIYGSVAKKLNVASRIKPNELVYAEVIGPGIQKGYTYGHTEHHLVIFDVKVFNNDGSWRWLNPEEVEQYAKDRGFDMVPVLYRGPYDKSMVESLVSGPSVYCPNEPIREGVVIKSRFEYNDQRCSSNKKALKIINPDYLLEDNTENH